MSRIDIKAADMIRFYVLISNRHIDIDSISKHKLTVWQTESTFIQKWITF